MRPIPEWEKEWGAAVKQVGVGEAEASLFAPFASVVKDFSVSQKCYFLEGLSRLRLEKDGLVGEPKYIVSATFLLGSSKLLDNLGRATTELGLDRFQPSPKYLAVAGPPKPQAVVLVENPNAFEIAVESSDLSRIAWACTYGFGLGNEKADQDGAMLENNLASNRTHILVRDGEPPRDIHALLGCDKLYFWGDLDLAGLRIYDNLKRHYSGLRLSALYKPMVQALLEGQCHPYTKCVGKDKQREVELRKAPLNDALARELAELCRDCAVDQEIVSNKHIERLAEDALSKDFSK